MYSVCITDENYNAHIYHLTLTISDIRTLYQLNIDINTFFISMPTLEELCLFFTICLQSTNISDGERFIDDYLNEHSMEDLMGIVPLFFGEVIGIEYKEEVHSDSNVSSDVNSEAINVVKILDDYLLVCLELGLTESQFNNMTLAEVKRYIDTYEKKRTRELKEQAMIEYITCDLMATSIGRLLSKDVKYPTFIDAFSNLFTEEEIEQIEEERAKAKYEQTIARMKAMAQAHNERLDKQNQEENQE